MSVTLLRGDCRDVLKTLPDESVHCVVTSPPYFGLRDYGVDSQIGLEPTPDAFVAEMVAVFREVRRVLRSDGTLWLNLGDSYVSSPPGNKGPPKDVDGAYARRSALQIGHGEDRAAIWACAKGSGLPQKNLLGIPWRVAFALQADGWWLRQDIIWSKPNPMPESVTDRCTKAHEYLFLLTKAGTYWYDAEAIKEDTPPVKPRQFGRKSPEAHGLEKLTGNMAPGVTWESEGGRNKRSVWTVNSHPFPEAHFATFPPALIEPCIKAGCPDKACAKCGAPWVREVEAESADGRKGIVRGGKAYDEDGRPLAGDNMIDHGTRGSFNVGAKGTLKRTTIGFGPSCGCDAGTSPGTVLDPFGGAGTTGLVADRLGRSAILIELNPEYAEMAEKRIKDDAGMFADVA